MMNVDVFTIKPEERIEHTEVESTDTINNWYYVKEGNITYKYNLFNVSRIVEEVLDEE